MLTTNKGEILTLKFPACPLLFKALSKKEWTTYNFQFSTFQSQYLHSKLRGTYSLVGCRFPFLIFRPLLGGGGDTSTTLGEGGGISTTSGEDTAMTSSSLQKQEAIS